jgi:hypothetical protein
MGFPFPVCGRFPYGSHQAVWFIIIIIIIEDNTAPRPLTKVAGFSH